MEYITKIEIQLPLERIIELFDNPNNLKLWQPELISFEHLSGEPGMPGSQSKLRYQMGKRKVEMIETITQRDLPHTFCATYEAKGVYNLQKNYFKAIDSHSTQWTCHSQFHFSGFMKAMAFFMPKAFQKQTLLFMNRFKDFAEQQ
ncbi:SRPBCC family protein [Prolixibacteraceae bacterium JC049]|nr:SRPBCC family protein [Prolixibacteraceae bacterium JC049]